MADIHNVWEIPLTSFRSVKLEKKRTSIPGWIKPESYKSGQYKMYKIKEDNFHYIHCRYYRAEVGDERGEFFLLVPEYDGELFLNLIRLRPGND